ncbi:MAG: hypothetical protein RQ751_10305 [Longimicrobiales bacterium]|nr:hypothetical protein [Longimicrobiales bacterium]
MSVLSRGALLPVLPALLLGAAGLQGQLPQAGAAGLGLGANMTASARGFAAVANNPAGLAHWATPGFSLAIPSLSLGSGTGPVTLGDLADWEGARIPREVREAWLTAIAADGGQSLTVDASATPVALNVGPVGFQLSTVAGGTADLSPDAAELLLFGNAGRTGEARDLALEGSTVDGYVLTTAALSLGARASDRVYLGVTGKYTMGNALLMGRDGGSLASTDPLEVALDFPVVVNRSRDTRLNNGTGVGLDLGILWEGPGFTLGARVENVVNTFSWDLDGLAWVPGQALFDGTDATSDFAQRPAESAPPEVRAAVDDLTLEPVYSLGVAWELPHLRVQADVRRRSDGGMALGPEYHAGVGAELTAVPFLPLRAHLAAVSGGAQLGGGATLVLGALNLSAGGAYRTVGPENALLGMVTLSFGGW